MPRSKKVKDIVDYFERKKLPAPPQECLDEIESQIFDKPVPLRRTKITQMNKALQAYTKSFEITSKNHKDPLVQLQNTRKGIENHFKTPLNVIIKF